MDENRETTNEGNRHRTIPTVSAVLPNGGLVEMVCDLGERRSAFVVWEHGAWRLESSIILDAEHRLTPYSPENNLIKNEVVLLPSAPTEYGTEAELINEVQTFIHRYADLTPVFERLAGT